jgi:hypothetical protein
MQKNLFGAVGLAVACLASSGLAWAHHGDAGRYNEDVIVITGTLVEVQMVNPHSLITFDVTGPNGQTVRWQAELGSSQQLTKQFGWNKTTMQVGQKLTITGRQAKNGVPYMNLTERSNIVLTDSGKEIFRTPNYGLPPGVEPPPQGQGSGTSPAAKP